VVPSGFFARNGSNAAWQLHGANRFEGPASKCRHSFVRYVEEKYGSALYLTSLTGECVRIYPMPEWEAIEERLSLLPRWIPRGVSSLTGTNYYGQQSSMDSQGRVLIHPLLRKSAGGCRRRSGARLFELPGSLGAGQVSSSACYPILIPRKTSGDRTLGNLEEAL